MIEPAPHLPVSSARDVLDALVAAAALRGDRRAWVALDLDGTLFDNRPRTLTILRAYGLSQRLAAPSRASSTWPWMSHLAWWRCGCAGRLRRIRRCWLRKRVRSCRFSCRFRGQEYGFGARRRSADRARTAETAAVSAIALKRLDPSRGGAVGGGAGNCRRPCTPPRLAYPAPAAALHLELPMPTVLRVGTWRFHFYSDEGLEPPHIHIDTGDGECKFWLEPVELARAQRVPPADLRRIERLVEANRSLSIGEMA